MTTTLIVLAVPRIVVGVLVAGHGLQKLAGWFGGHGVTGTAGFFEDLRIRQPRVWAIAVGVSETVGGGLMALGLLQPLGQIAVATVLIAAIALVHWRHGLWAANNGIELPLVMAAIALSSGIAPVGVALDDAVALVVPTWLVVLTIVGAAAATLLSVGGRGPRGHAGTLAPERPVRPVARPTLSPLTPMRPAWRPSAAVELVSRRLGWR